MSEGRWREGGKGGREEPKFEEGMLQHYVLLVPVLVVDKPQSTFCASSFCVCYLLRL